MITKRCSGHDKYKDDDSHEDDDNDENKNVDYYHDQICVESNSDYDCLHSFKWQSIWEIQYDDNIHDFNDDDDDDDEVQWSWWWLMIIIVFKSVIILQN